jgi:hypothetical protein
MSPSSSGPRAFAAAALLLSTGPALAEEVILTPSQPITGTITLTPAPIGPLTVNPQATALPIIAGPAAVASGTRLCVTTASGCGFTKADWGGTCWQAPADDGKGTWARSAVAVDKDDAFWRVPTESTKAATRVKNTAWAWECPSGSFWDGYDWGACWTCPTTHPRRTAAAV